MLCFPEDPCTEKDVYIQFQSASRYLIYKVRQWHAEGCDGPGHPGGGHPTREFFFKKV